MRKAGENFYVLESIKRFNENKPQWFAAKGGYTNDINAAMQFDTEVDAKIYYKNHLSSHLDLQVSEHQYFSQDEMPRRNRMDLMSKAELAILKATDEVEKVGAHEKLTEAVILLTKARELVADYVDFNL